MGIKNIVNSIGGKSANSISKLSELGPAEIKKVEQKRVEYFSKLPSPQDNSAIELTEKLLAANGIEIYNAYLDQLKEIYLPLDNSIELNGNYFDSNHNIRLINITKWVIDKKEDSLEKLVNVYAVLSNEEVNVSLVFQRTKETTNVYLAVTNLKNANNNIEVEKIYKSRLVDALKGNFPGSEWNDDSGIGQPDFLKNIDNVSVAIASNIPTVKSEKFISQTIEKLIDGFTPRNRKEEYILILMATPIQDVEERKLRLSEIYSSLAPYSSWQTNFTFNNSDSFGSSATVGVNVGASAGIQNTANVARTNSIGETNSENNTIGHTKSDGTSHTEGESESDTVGTSKGKTIGVSVGVKKVIEIGVNGSLTYTESKSHTISKNTSDTISKNVANSISKTVGKAVNTGKSITEGLAKGTSLGANFGANFARSSTTTATIGYGEGITQNFTNYNIKHSLELLEEQMKRYELSTALGLWDFSAYVLSEDNNVANNIAHNYIALTQGENSNMSKTAINVWRGDLGEDSGQARTICEYLKDLRHPIFGLNPEVLKFDESYSAYPTIVTATTPLSGRELSYSLNFPRKSIPGLPVIEAVEFGRNISKFDNSIAQTDIYLGKIFHMHHIENTKVSLDKSSLASHTFVTGSTGSGKSNTIYQLISEAEKNNVKFLVIEPAKGEYKSVFGDRKDVKVLGTNPLIGEILKINPFSFPKNVHVLEHMDRLVEVFNVAWPMYAAMPAVLKKAIEKSYVESGWDLLESKNTIYENIFPSFNDVMFNIKKIIDDSDYDDENKGAYKGSLVTRIESLTNGINGLIFSNDEISYEKLFNSNVIIDLSRVGSLETKSLIMGIIVLKLQEHHLSNSFSINAELKHITVLEEAHNLLKRTSSGLGTEDGNLTGKSVEMLANAIAEMRTYGEGFIIADQAPGLLDSSVIRNTNTKIIMRLPDLSDRELVGKSANLNDEQISELAKLPRGVGAIYQNEWIQPILCKVEKFDSINTVNNDIRQSGLNNKMSTEIEITKQIDDFVKSELNGIIWDTELQNEMKNSIISSHQRAALKKSLISYLNEEKDNHKLFSEFLFEYFEVESVIEKCKNCSNYEDWEEVFKEEVGFVEKGYTDQEINKIIIYVLDELGRRDYQYFDLICKMQEVFDKNRRLF